MISKKPLKEQLSDGVTREILDEGHIQIFTLTDMTRETVDVWVAACDAFMQECLATGHPLLILQDFSDPNVGQTPYSKARGSTLTHAYPSLGGRIAFVLPLTVSAQQLRLFIRSQPSENRQRQAFHTRTEGLDWLRACD